MSNEEYCLQKNISHSSLLIPHLIIPNGKGKVEKWLKKIEDEIMYQFPMGKVKLTDYWFDRYVTYKKYQFPMGKVKEFVRWSEIPPGTLYQFPMGKVKNKI